MTARGLRLLLRLSRRFGGSAGLILTLRLHALALEVWRRLVLRQAAFLQIMGLEQLLAGIRM